MTCPGCYHGVHFCDDHGVPPVCICDTPTPLGGGECTTCHRPYKPEVPEFDACREAWRTHLLQEAT